MKLTNKEYWNYTNDKHIYIIKYITKYSKGEMSIKKSLWERCQRKFNKAMKDATIISMEEIIES